MRKIETVNIRVIGRQDGGVIASAIVDIKQVPRHGERIVINGVDYGQVGEVYWDNSTARRTAYIGV